MTEELRSLNISDQPVPSICDSSQSPSSNQCSIGVSCVHTDETERKDYGSCNCNEVISEGSDREHVRQIDSLPTEVLLKIFYYLDARFLYCTLTLVSRYFNYLLNDDSSWKMRIAKRFPKKYPPLKAPLGFNWKLACAKREYQHELWSHGGMERFTLTEGHYASVDAIHLMNRGTMCLSGSRDKQLTMWNLQGLDSNNPHYATEAKAKSVIDAHKGWIWSITSCENVVCTGSWDKDVKLWDAGENLRETMRLRRAPLGFNWKLACAKREYQHELWSHGGMERFTLTEGHYASVDAIHLMNRGTMCLSGSRDKQLTMWNLQGLDSNNPHYATEAKAKSVIDAHKGWIWSITSCENVVCTGSWDKDVKLWDAGENLRETMRLRGKSAVLCTALRPDILSVGSFDKHVTTYDPRAGYSATKQLVYHTKPVLCMAVDDQYIISGSEDRTVAVYDRRADKLLRTVELPNFVMSLSYKWHHLWVGDRSGQIHLIDSTDFTFVDTYDVGHTNKVTGIKFSLGALVTCSTDKSIRVLTPTECPTVMHILHSDHDSDISAIDLQNDVLVSASGETTVTVWKPRP
ncbi:PREDICTED: F-box/WD repeat-containing protein 9-like [Priapulus caudatus]|uniref:F-box/WD repeat-containing protein 9-like n=1 Tax=Priapulus caudatus TaxID=37621 RepID=A0ABM1E0W3_PRICU|nr:PREDICTED: F-box/WD repeat-containing protein 9-like [Priapulus caudatus]